MQKVDSFVVVFLIVSINLSALLPASYLPSGKVLVVMFGALLLTWVSLRDDFQLRSINLSETFKSKRTIIVVSLTLWAYLFKYLGFSI